MERTEALPRIPRLPKGRVLADDLDDIGRGADIGEDPVVEVEVVGHLGTISCALT